MKTHNLLTRTKSKTPEIRVKESKVLIIFVALFAIVAATSPFWHIFFEKGNPDGVFGFKSMRSFLYAFGTHFALFGVSFFTTWLVTFIQTENKYLKRAGYVVSFTFLSVSIYFLLYVFIDTNSPYPDYMYEITFIISSMASALFTILFFRFLKAFKLKKLQYFKQSREFEDKAMSFIEQINNSFINN